MIIEEYGMKIDSGQDAREAAFRTWLARVAKSHGAGALVWMIAGPTANGERYPDYDHYTIYSAGDAPAIRDFAQTPLS